MCCLHVLIWSIFLVVICDGWWEPLRVVSGLVLTHSRLGPAHSLVPTRHANPGLTLPVGRTVPASDWSIGQDTGFWLAVGPGSLCSTHTTTTECLDSGVSRTGPGPGNLWSLARGEKTRQEVWGSDKCQPVSSSPHPRLRRITDLSPDWHRPDKLIVWNKGERVIEIRSQTSNIWCSLTHRVNHFCGQILQFILK